MNDIALVMSLGFFLGMRHATDADHVMAITTIVTRSQRAGQAALMGLLWGVGHTLTIVAVGASIILLNLAVSEQVSARLELLVGLMLIALGAVNVVSFYRHRWTASVGGRRRPSRHAHSHGDDVGWPRSIGATRVYSLVRPLAVGIVHGLAGSAAVTLLVLATIRDPRWAVVYLVVFGIGTIAGMTLITIGLAAAFGSLGRRSSVFGQSIGLASGLGSVAFGLWLTYQMSAAAQL